MSVQSKNITLSFLSIVYLMLIFSVLAGNAESDQARKADLNAQSVEIKMEVAVARDISLNALSNVMATFNDTEKGIIVTLQTGYTSDIKSMVACLDEVWKSEKDVLKQIEKISTYMTVATSALNNAAIQLESISGGSDSKLYFKQADKATATARRNVNKATAIAEKLKQTWLLPLEKTPCTKK